MKTISIGTTVDTGKPFALPLDFISKSQAILAKRGSGKSYTASVQAEGILALGMPICVIDPTGAWWGLRSSADGKSEGYPVPTGVDLQVYWRNELKGGAARMLEVICAAHPNSISREDIGAQSGLSPASGTFGTYLSKLRTLELVSKSGEIRACDELFE